MVSKHQTTPKLTRIWHILAALLFTSFVALAQEEQPRLIPEGAAVASANGTLSNDPTEIDAISDDLPTADPPLRSENASSKYILAHLWNESDNDLSGDEVVEDSASNASSTLREVIVNNTIESAEDDYDKEVTESQMPAHADRHDEENNEDTVEPSTSNAGNDVVLGERDDSNTTSVPSSDRKAQNTSDSIQDEPSIERKIKQDTIDDEKAMFDDFVHDSTDVSDTATGMRGTIDKVENESENSETASTKRSGEQGQFIEQVDSDYQRPVCGVWGKYQGNPTPNISILYLYFREEVLNERKPRSKVIGADELAEQITDSAFDRARNDQIEVDEARTEAIKRKARSANSEFVDGLDDIDKFFEDVDPPDELDVGAGGSSIQEVLMGQGSRIIVKRIFMGLAYIRDLALSLKDKAVGKIRGEDGNIVLFDKEDINGAIEWVLDRSKELFHIGKALADHLMHGIFSDAAEEDLDFQYEPPRPGKPIIGS